MSGSTRYQKSLLSTRFTSGALYEYPSRQQKFYLQNKNFFVIIINRMGAGSQKFSPAAPVQKALKNIRAFYFVFKPFVESDNGKFEKR